MRMLVWWASTGLGELCCQATALVYSPPIRQGREIADNPKIEQGLIASEPTVTN